MRAFYDCYEKIGCLRCPRAAVVRLLSFPAATIAAGRQGGLFPEEEKATLTLRGGNEIESIPEAMKQFAEKYGKEVEIAICQYDEEQSMESYLIAAGAIPRRGGAERLAFPAFSPSRAGVQPLDDLIDMNSEELGKNVMENMFSITARLSCGRYQVDFSLCAVL